MKFPFLKPLKQLHPAEYLTDKNGDKVFVDDYVFVGSHGDYYGIGRIVKIDAEILQAYVDLVPWLSPGFDGSRLYVPSTYLELDKNYEERRKK
jgi:hypothetical protein